jgi:hypothetical protein
VSQRYKILKLFSLPYERDQAFQVKIVRVGNMIIFDGEYGSGKVTFFDGHVFESLSSLNEPDMESRHILVSRIGSLRFLLNEEASFDM